MPIKVDKSTNKQIACCSIPASIQTQSTVDPRAKRHSMAFRWRADCGALLNVYWGANGYVVSMSVSQPTCEYNQGVQQSKTINRHKTPGERDART